MTTPQSRSLPLEANEEMIEAARSLRVNLRFGNTGISGSLSAWEISELWRLMVAVAPDGTTPSETGDSKEIERLRGELEKAQELAKRIVAIKVGP